MAARTHAFGKTLFLLALLFALSRGQEPVMEPTLDADDEAALIELMEEDMEPEFSMVPDAPLDLTAPMEEESLPPALDTTETDEGDDGADVASVPTAEESASMPGEDGDTAESSDSVLEVGRRVEDGEVNELDEDDLDEIATNGAGRGMRKAAGFAAMFVIFLSLFYL